MIRRFLILFLFSLSAYAGEENRAYLESQERKSTALFNAKIDKDIWQTAAHAQIKFIHLAAHTSLAEKNFLLENPEHLQEISAADLKKLRKVLDQAHLMTEEFGGHHMAYELGIKPLSMKYWHAIERIKPIVEREPSPIWQVLGIRG